MRSAISGTRVSGSATSRLAAAWLRMVSTWKRIRSSRPRFWRFAGYGIKAPHFAASRRRYQRALPDTPRDAVAAGIRCPGAQSSRHRGIERVHVGSLSAPPKQNLSCPPKRRHSISVVDFAHFYFELRWIASG
jgi:hypothetical protein